MTPALVILGLVAVSSLFLRLTKCQHVEVIKRFDADDQRLYFVCSSCRFREPAITRTAEDFTRLQRLQGRMAQSRPVPRKADVISLAERRGASR